MVWTCYLRVSRKRQVNVWTYLLSFMPVGYPIDQNGSHCPPKEWHLTLSFGFHILKHTCTHVCTCMHILHMLINQLISQKIESKESRFHEGKLFFFLSAWTSGFFWSFWTCMVKINLIFKGHSLVFFKLTFQYWFAFCEVFSLCRRNTLNSLWSSTIVQWTDYQLFELESKRFWKAGFPPLTLCSVLSCTHTHSESPGVKLEGTELIKAKEKRKTWDNISKNNSCNRSTWFWNCQEWVKSSPLPISQLFLVLSLGAKENLAVLNGLPVLLT